MNNLQTPRLSLSLSELARSGLEASTLATRIHKLIRQSPNGNGQPILTLPGYGGGDGSMAVIRFFLKQLGYKPYALELGRNYEPPEERIKRIEHAVAFREKMVEKVCSRLETLHQQEQQKITLIGWSMGGLYALDASQTLPHCTQQVITLGSPFGDPRGTAAFNLLRTLNRSDIPLEEQDFSLWLNKREIKTQGVPIKVLYSNKDGIVGLDTARLNEHPDVEHIETASSHVGFAINPVALQTVANLLHKNLSTELV